MDNKSKVELRCFMSGVEIKMEVDEEKNVTIFSGNEMVYFSEEEWAFVVSRVSSLQSNIEDSVSEEYAWAIRVDAEDGDQNNASDQ